MAVLPAGVPPRPPRSAGRKETVSPPQGGDAASASTARGSPATCSVTDNAVLLHAGICPR